MNILIIGSGGTEHALAWKIAQSPECAALFIAPGNAGTQNVGTNLDLFPNDHAGISSAVKDLKIYLLLVGPEQPLADGLVDHLKEDPELKDLMIIGPGRQGAMLESSKDFAKAFMRRHSIPTADYRSFTTGELEEGIAYLATLQPPFVLKADGLAAGKGVIITSSPEEARHVLQSMLEGRFGKASSRVVVEEFLQGTELSVFIVTDGINYRILPEAKDYKRIGDGDTGPNTGGMGSVSPVPFADEAFMTRVEERIIRPTVQGLTDEGIPYCGFIFFGLINVSGDPYVIEYNVRMGDPETQSVIPRIASDLLILLRDTARANLASSIMTISTWHAVSIVLASGGYPDDYQKGYPIEGWQAAGNTLVFHAGTQADEHG
ncbi:MAG: phosphoribosylamine--glycine ligase, partial [Bacteroidales bacterium]|nr:phosphoribosylamine--glycine ligase [Bacteroidales bacterium]